MALGMAKVRKQEVDQEDPAGTNRVGSHRREALTRRARVQVLS
jgi:hypothetical protein